MASKKTIHILMYLQFCVAYYNDHLNWRKGSLSNYAKFAEKLTISTPCTFANHWVRNFRISDNFV